VQFISLIIKNRGKMENITRRDALKRIYQAVIAVGASSFISFEDLLAADSNNSPKPAVIWLHGSSCSGCSVSFLNGEDVPVVDLITKFSELVFHPDLSAATGDQVINIMEKLSASNKGFIFVLEGGIPVKLPHACLIGDKPLTHWIDKLVPKSIACVSAGTCSALGGIPQMAGSLTGSTTLSEYLQSQGIKKPVVNIPGCPMKPEHITYVLLHYIKKGSLPKLDPIGRPEKFFKKSIHNRCIYYADYQEDFFAEFIGDEGCLFKLGCQGPTTKNDCSVRGYNGNTNNCIKAGHPCVGCAGEEFPRNIMLHSFNDKRFIEKKV
jgi:hydrogenase small subunit